MSHPRAVRTRRKRMQDIKEERKAKYKLGDRVKVRKLLDNKISRCLLGFRGHIQEVSSLSNGEYGYYIKGNFFYEEELKKA